MIPLRKHAFGIAALAAAAVCLCVLARTARKVRATAAWGGAAGALLDRVAAAPRPGLPAGGLTLPPSAAEVLAPSGGRRSAGARERFFAALEARFRLAGFKLSPGNPDASRAIVEDRESRRQWLRRKGESLARGVALSAIETNAVTLATPYGEYRLALSRRDRPGEGAAAPGAAAPQAAPAAEFSFGDGAVARLEGAEESPGTWRIARDDLMAYYDEVRRRPERLEAVFDTLAPIWYVDDADGAQKIEGYRVEPCGEERFFSAMGLREGDVVREVNGIRMTNRYAAEELIRRFADGDLDFAHIKMERGGEEIVQSYFLK